MLLQAVNITKTVKGTDNKSIKILQNINLSIESGDFLTILGPSGSGKTTLLQILGLMDSPTDGEIIISGTNSKSLSSCDKAQLRAKDIGFVFQKALLLTDLTVEENLILPLKNINKAIHHREINDLLAKVGLENKKNSYPRMLSAGEAQRAALAKAIITSPQIILADEPIANLDKENKVIILKLLKLFNHENKISMILASHDDLVLEYSKRSVKLTDGKIKLPES